MPDTVNAICDDWGIYEVAADSIFFRAKRRRDGWWDQRYRDGKEAVRQFKANAIERQARWLNGEET